MDSKWIRPRDMGNADYDYDRLREMEDARADAVAALRRATAVMEELAKEVGIDPDFLKAIKP